MYQPAHFRVDDAAAHRALIAAHPLATLVVPTARGLEVNTCRCASTTSPAA